MIESQRNIRYSWNTVPVKPKALSGGERANGIERIEVACLLISLCTCAQNISDDKEDAESDR